MSNLDMSKKYCTKAWHPGGNDGRNIHVFKYTMVDCDSNEEQERICMKKPNDCSAQAGRKKRNAEVASLDIYFKDQESSKVKKLSALGNGDRKKTEKKFGLLPNGGRGFPRKENIKLLFWGQKRVIMA